MLKVLVIVSLVWASEEKQLLPDFIMLVVVIVVAADVITAAVFICFSLHLLVSLNCTLQDFKPHGQCINLM